MNHGERAQKLKELRTWYLDELDRELAAFRNLLEHASGHGDPRVSPWLEMRRLAHNWCGSGGSYGFPAWSAAAKPLEAAIDAGASAAAIAGCFEHALLVRATLCSDSGER